jgi:hypothetical protein
LLGLLFNSENEGEMLLWNIGSLLGITTQKSRFGL